MKYLKKKIFKIQKFCTICLIGLFFSACTQPSMSIKPQCKKLENEIIKLKNDNYVNLAKEIVTIPVGGYAFKKDSSDEQNLKVLEMKLQECNQKK